MVVDIQNGKIKLMSASLDLKHEMFLSTSIWTIWVIHAELAYAQQVNATPFIFLNFHF